MNKEYGLKIWRLLHKLGRISRKNFKLPNLTDLETRVLYNIEHYYRKNNIGISIRELKIKLNVSSPTISQVVNDLEKRDIVKRVADVNDGRITRVEVSQIGKKELEEAVQSVESRFIKLADSLGDDKSQQLIGILQDIITYFTEEEQHE